MYKLPIISPTLFTLSANVIGYLLIDELTSTEQNALGNWFMLIGQVLCTNGSYTFHTGGSSATNNNSTFESQNKTSNFNTNDQKQTIDMLTKTVEAIQKEIEELKKYNY